MKKSLIFNFLLIASVILTLSDINGQELNVFTPLKIQKAIEQKTRTTIGIPGEKYWQNSADYSMDITFDPTTRLLSGSETITYWNNSPDTLNYILIHLFSDLYKRNSLRDFIIEPEDLHDGVEISNMKINDKRINFSNSSRNVLFGDTYAFVGINDPIAPLSKNTITLNWSYTVNKGSHMRTGQVDPTSFFIAYFFPRIGVYDDIEGWNNYVYTGVGEFYNDFGDFNVNISVPGGFIVWATGELQNPEFTLSDKYYQRYKEAKNSDEIIKIISSSDLIYKDFTAPDPMVTWNFKAQDVSDFAFAISDHYLWEGTQLQVDNTGEKKVFIQTAYDKNSNDFHKVIHIAKKSINYMSFELPGQPFPYPEITIFNGLDEMEYPMMVNDHSLMDIKQTFSLTAHEIYHSYFPFLTGCNEKKYAWMDEGLTSFFEYNLIRDIVDSSLVSLYFLKHYFDHINGTEKDLPLFSSSEIIRPPDYYAISYPKAAAFYSVVVDEIGMDMFRSFIGNFIFDWQGKHPTGTDFLNALNAYSDEDLEWLIRPWFFEFGYVDLGIEKVLINKNSHSIKIVKKGNLPAAVKIKSVFEDGTFSFTKRKPSVWKSEAQEITINTKKGKKINSFELVFDIPMDSNPENNKYIMADNPE